MTNPSSSLQQNHLERLACEMAGVDCRFEPLADTRRTEAEFYKILCGNIFLPDSSILSGGRDDNPILLSSTALNVNDSFENIFSVLKRTSMFLQSGVRVALDFSDLRAARSLIGSSHLQSVGPVRFMEFFERAPQSVSHKTTLYFLLRLDHLDIMDYLDYVAKSPAHVHCAVVVPQEFVPAFTLNGTLGLTYKPGSEAARTVQASELLDRLSQLVQMGKPLDIFFADALSRFRKERGLATDLVLNPDAQLVYPGELMAMGLVNLKAFIKSTGFDYTALGDATQVAVHFLDNCFEKNFYTDDESRTITRRTFRMGLGVTGLGEVLQEMNPHGSVEKSQRLLEKIQDTLMTSSLVASQVLGERRGARHVITYKGQTYRTRHVQTISQATICKIPLKGLSATKFREQFFKMHEMGGALRQI